MILSLLVATVLATDRAVELNAVGDIMLARGVQRYIQKPGSLSLIRGDTIKALKGDIILGNLESPLTPREPVLSKQFLFSSSSENVSQISGRFNVLSLANNHALDCGPEGLFDTLATLESQHVAAIGLGALVVITAGAVRVGFLGYCDFPRPDKGIAYLDEALLPQQIQDARKKCDVLVLSFHWGIEYDEKPSIRQKHIARLATRLGASLIVGHHPHVLQPIEWVRVGSKKCLVAYSLGNFIFDSHPPIAKLSGVLKCKIGKKGVVSYTFVPMVIEHYAPRLSSAGEHRKISRSQERDTHGRPILH